MNRLRLISGAGLIIAALFAAAIILVPSGRQILAAVTSNGDGTATGTGTVIGTPVPFSDALAVTIEGDYVAAGASMRGTGPPGSGTITLPALPLGSTTHSAFLYWGVMNSTADPALAEGTLNGNNITGSLVGVTADPCWNADDHYAYVADVTAIAVPGAANSLDNFASGGLPIDTQPILNGASLIVVYENPASTEKRIVIRQGSRTFAGLPIEDVSIDWSLPASGAHAFTTFVMSDGQINNNRSYFNATLTSANAFPGADPGTGKWDTVTQDVTALVPVGATSGVAGVEASSELGVLDCITWVAQVMSVELEPPPPTPTPSPSPTPGPTPDPDGPVGGIVEVRVGGTADSAPQATSDNRTTPAVWILLLAVGLALGGGAWAARRRPIA